MPRFGLHLRIGGPTRNAPRDPWHAASDSSTGGAHCDRRHNVCRRTSQGSPIAGDLAQDDQLMRIQARYLQRAEQDLLKSGTIESIDQSRRLSRAALG
ncbi:MAG: hypothetical protein JNM20_13510 [Rhizobiales bacterium]|nr:hypothetical protein [Hyphomicrobiales bacterium]